MVWDEASAVGATGRGRHGGCSGARLPWWVPWGEVTVVGAAGQGQALRECWVAEAEERRP